LELKLKTDVICHATELKTKRWLLLWQWKWRIYAWPIRKTL